MEDDETFFNFKDIVSINVNILSFFGIIPPKLETTMQKINHSIRVAVLLILFFATLVTSELLNLYLSFDDIKKFAESSFLTLANWSTVVYYYCIFKYRNRIRNLINSINRKEFQPKNGAQKNILNTYIRTSKVITLSLQGACATTSLFWGIYPYTVRGGPFLPTPAYIPYSIDDPIVFNITYVYLSIAVLCSGVMNTSADSLISGLLMAACAELKLLNDSLQNLRQYAEEARELDLRKIEYIDIDKQMSEHLIKCIIQHRYILIFVNEISDIFATAIFVQFLVAVIILCTTLFEMTLVPIISIQFFSYVCFQYCIITEIFIFCYFGSSIQEESMKLMKSAYNSDWTQSSNAFKRTLLFFMTRCQKDLQLYAGGVFSLSLDNFLVIIKSSVSYFTVLTQLSVDTN